MFHHGYFFLYLLSWIEITMPCLPDGALNRVQIGFPTYVCLTLAPMKWVQNGTFVRVASKMKADEVGSINMKHCESKIPMSALCSSSIHKYLYSFFITSRIAWTSIHYHNDTAMKKFEIESSHVGNGLAVAIESMGVISAQKAYRTVQYAPNSTSALTSTITFPLLMAIINVENGIVKVSDLFPCRLTFVI